MAVLGVAARVRSRASQKLDADGRHSAARAESSGCWCGGEYSRIPPHPAKHSILPARLAMHTDMAFPGETFLPPPDCVPRFDVRYSCHGEMFCWSHTIYW
jgi:hypothetical protein